MVVPGPRVNPGQPPPLLKSSLLFPFTISHNDSADGAPLRGTAGPRSSTRASGASIVPELREGAAKGAM